jgi:cytoskeleton protein RodZ
MALGEQLRKARLARKETTSQVANATRMKVQQVEAIENEDFSKIPAPIYAKGFIKLYAEHVGLDPQPLIGDYITSFLASRRPTSAPEQVVALTEEDRKADHAETPARAQTQAEAPKEDKKPHGRRPEREFSEPDLFSRVGMPAGGLEAPAAKASPPASLFPETDSAPPEPAPEPGPGPVMSVAPPAPEVPVPSKPAIPAAPPPAVSLPPIPPLPPGFAPKAAPSAPPKGPAFSPKKEERRPLKLEAERAAPPADTSRVQSLLESWPASAWRRIRKADAAVRTWVQRLGGKMSGVLDDFSFSRLLNSPAKITVLVLGVVVILLFVISGLSRAFRPTPKGDVAPGKVQKELQLTVDPPAPYFE